MVIALMACRRLVAVGAEQAIPPRQVEAEVAVGLARGDRVVHAVHVRRHHDPAQHAVEPGRHAHVAVVEHGGGVEQHLEGQHGDRWRAQRGDHAELDAHREQDLDRVEARARGHVELQVRVMHAVQPPQRGDRVEKHVLQVDGEIEGDHGQRHADPYRQRERVEQAPSLRLGDQGEADGGRRKQQANQNRIEHDNADVARPARPARRSSGRGAAQAISQAAMTAKMPAKAKSRISGLVAEQQFRHRECLTTARPYRRAGA